MSASCPGNDAFLDRRIVLLMIISRVTLHQPARLFICRSYAIQQVAGLRSQGNDVRMSPFSGLNDDVPEVSHYFWIDEHNPALSPHPQLAR